MQVFMDILICKEIGPNKMYQLLLFYWNISQKL